MLSELGLQLLTDRFYLLTDRARRSSLEALRGIFEDLRRTIATNSRNVIREVLFLRH